MARAIDHECRDVECVGDRAKWYGLQLHCMKCDAWQKEKKEKKDYVGPLGKEAHQSFRSEFSAVMFTCPLCGKMNTNTDCKKVGEAWRVWCHECSQTGIIQG